MPTIYLIFALVISAVAVIFALQNSIAVTISFLSWEISGSLSLVLLGTLGIGMLISLLVLAPSAFKNRLKSSSQRKRITALEHELSEHKRQIVELQNPSSVLPSPTTPSPLHDSPARQLPEEPL